MLDEAVERAAQRHQAGDFVLPGIGEGAAERSMGDLAPGGDAACLEPGVQRVEIGEAGRRLPQPATCVLDALLDLPLLPTRGGIAEGGVEQIVAGHGGKAGVHLSSLAGSDAIHGSLHVVVDAAGRDAAEHTKRMIVGVKQHLVGLKRVRSHDEDPAVRQLGVRDLKLDAFASENGPVLAPVELERLARCKGQRNERPSSRSMLLGVPIRFPVAHEGCDTIVRAVIAQAKQIGVQLTRCTSLLARSVRLRLQPTGQLGCEWV